MPTPLVFFKFFFFNDTATTEIYTLSLHDALPISTPALACLPALSRIPASPPGCAAPTTAGTSRRRGREDRKSTRLNSSHGYISYAVFCLKKKKLGDELALRLIADAVSTDRHCNQP